MAWHGRFLIMAIIGLTSFWAQSVLALNVFVDACQPVFKGIQIKRNFSNTWQTLTNGCRDAGYGLRDYTLQCLSSTQYRVEWSECVVPTETQTTPQNTPVVSVPAPVNVQPIIQPVAMPSPVETFDSHALEAVAGTSVSNACSGHGWVHGDHCHCDAGYYAAGLECRALPTTSVPTPVSVVASASSHNQPVTQVAVQTNTQSVVVACSGHGWVHGDHCHCDAGYYASGLQCLTLPSSTPVQLVNAQAAVKNTTPTVKNSGSTTGAAKSTVGNTKTALECNGHGWIHGDHCHCDAGYYASGTQCLALPGTVLNSTNNKTESIKSSTKSTIATAVKKPSNEMVPVQTTTPIIECNGHGHLHGDQCHCDNGFVAEGQSCVIMPQREAVVFKAINGHSYKDGDFWVRPLTLFVYDFEGKSIVHWEGAQGDYDGFLVYVKPGSFAGPLDAYQPIWLSRRQYSFAYDSARSGQHTMYVFPYITLTNGEVRRLEPGGVISWIQPGQTPKLSGWQIFLNILKGN